MIRDRGGIITIQLISGHQGRYQNQNKHFSLIEMNVKVICRVVNYFIPYRITKTSKHIKHAENLAFKGRKAHVSTTKTNFIIFCKTSWTKTHFSSLRLISKFKQGILTYWMNIELIWQSCELFYTLLYNKDTQIYKLCWNQTLQG